jgi:hypothetical protein
MRWLSSRHIAMLMLHASTRPDMQATTAPAITRHKGSNAVLDTSELTTEDLESEPHCYPTALLTRRSSGPRRSPNLPGAND